MFDTAYRRLDGNDWVKVRSGMMPSHGQAPSCCSSKMTFLIDDLNNIGKLKLNHQDCESWLIGDKVGRVIVRWWLILCLSLDDGL